MKHAKPWWRTLRPRLHKDAEAEVEKSQELLQETKKYTRPIRAAEVHNQFSDMIRDALRVGYGPPTESSDKR